jgi:hypothetical protein
MKQRNLRRESKNQLIGRVRGFELAIKFKCHECMNGQRYDCEITACPLYPLRPQLKHAA